MPLSPRLLRPRASGSIAFLLDQFGGASAAYSLRRLRTGYTGAAVRVRRSNDNAEANFTAEELANGTLAAWTGANDGFVVTWYDQSGSGLNVTQAASTSQPKIVSSGSLETLNGRPGIRFDGSNDQLNSAASVSGFTGNPSITAFFVVKKDATLNGKVFGLGNPGATNGAFGFWSDTSLNFWGYGGGQGQDVTAVPLTQRMELLFKSPGAHDATGIAYRNGANVATTADATTPNIQSGNLAVGRYTPTGTVAFFEGLIQELVLWPQNHSGQRSLLESNVNSYYSVF